MNKRREWRIAGIVLAIATLLMVIYFAMKNITVVTEGVSLFFSALTPFIYGGILAYLMLPCFNFFCKILQSKINKPTLVKAVSMLLCFVIIFVMIFALAGFIVPQLLVSIYEVAQSTTIPQNAQQFAIWLESRIADYPQIQAQVHIIYQTCYDYVANWVQGDFLGDITTIMVQLTSGVYSIVKIMMNLAIGMIVMVYIFMNKEHFVAQGKKLCYGVLNTQAANIVIEKIRFTHKVFGGFITGKLLDSAIIGILAFVILSVLKMPYVLLLSVIIGITNIIPFFGPFIGAIPITILMLLVEPMKAVVLVVVILILQLLDGYIIGPKILSESTGLTSFWVLFSILLFGGVFGFIGMLIGVPLFAVIYNLISSIINYLLGKRGLSQTTDDYAKVEKIDPQTKTFQ